jgi:hypothetical protein
MKSQWYELKPEAVAMRRKGKSIRDVEISLGIPRSTLSGWFKKITLSKKQKDILNKKYGEAIIKARKNAVLWHNNQKKERLQKAEVDAEATLSKIILDKETIELCMAILYLGEGSKKSSTTGMGNSDPLILKFFLKVMTSVYKINLEKIRFDLHLRADQNPKLMKKYWAKELNAPLHRFNYVSVDKRTLGKKTYPGYKGVCLIDCGNIAIQRKLVYIGRKFCDKTIKNLGG